MRAKSDREATAPALSVGGSTRIVGIFGDPVAATLSPRMHNHALQKLGLDLVYVPFLVKPDRLRQAVESIRSLHLLGVNVTIPHKQAVMPCLDEIAGEAKTAGAVNTIHNRAGRLVGHNTDAAGFLASLRADGGFEPKGKKAVLRGAGGVAFAIASSLAQAGIGRLIVVNRTRAKAEELVKHVSALTTAPLQAMDHADEDLGRVLRECDLFVNAAPVGLEHGAFPVAPRAFLSPDTFVFDANYSRATPLLEAARAAGAPALNGLGMLIHQGALSFSIWTGEKPPVELMREALREER